MKFTDYAAIRNKRFDEAYFTHTHAFTQINTAI